MRNEFFRFGHLAQHGRLFLCVERWMKKDGDRRSVLSVDLLTEDEIDAAIDELKADLEQERRAAKAALKRLDRARPPAANAPEPRPLG